MVIKPNTKEGVTIMITKKGTFAQLPKELGLSQALVGRFFMP